MKNTEMTDRDLALVSAGMDKLKKGGLVDDKQAADLEAKKDKFLNGL